MASATGIPETRSGDATNHGRGEQEPLLGRAGDASQQEDQGLQFNFVIGELPLLAGSLSSAHTSPRYSGYCSSGHLDCKILPLLCHSLYMS